jgi:hypothetical protein
LQKYSGNCDKNVTHAIRAQIWNFAMPKMVKKADLPSKICAACEKPFAWRKKWAKDWENVRFCSDRCRRAR